MSTPADNPTIPDPAEERRNRELSQARHRYATDPEYRKRKIERARLRRTVPDHYARRAALHRHKLETDQEYAEKHRRYYRDWARRKTATDPEYAERQLRANRERKRRLSASDPDYRANRRDSYREWESRKTAADPEWAEQRRRANRQRNRLRKPWDDTVTAESVAALLAQQRQRCVACKTKLRADGYEMDHIVPASKGGASTLSNLQLLCPSCNRRKGNRPSYFPAGEAQGVLW